jgi:probable HAF family extracellular repeat protein
VHLIRTAGALAFLFMAAVWHVAAEDKVFFMELPPEVLPLAVGANAFAVTGGYYSGGGMSWMPTSGDQKIGGTGAYAISRDGKTIAGRALDSRGLENAAVWQGGGNWRVLGSFASDSRPCDRLLSATFGASADGRVIVGLGWDGCNYAHAFRWDVSTGMVDLGSTNGRSTRANAVSGDGRVVVGWQEDPTGPRLGAKWVNRSQEPITGPNGPVGEAFAANIDGSIIVGTRCNFADPQASAWTWTASKGVQCFLVSRPPVLPPLPYAAQMRAVSDDGRVIGGAFTFGLDSESLIWLDGQVYFLKDYLQANGYPDAFRRWVNSGFVLGVSPDGRTLVGYGAGPTTFQGFMVILPPRAKA